MKLTMTRFAVVIAAIAVATVGLFGTAQAQYEPTDPAPTVDVIRGSTFHVPNETANRGALGFGSINPQPGSGAAAGDTTGGTGGGLAITGSETDMPLAIGIGLLALGGTAVVASRKRD